MRLNKPVDATASESPPLRPTRDGATSNTRQTSTGRMTMSTTAALDGKETGSQGAQQRRHIETQRIEMLQAILENVTIVENVPDTPSFSC